MIRTTAGPMPFLYRYQLAAEHDETVVRLDAEVELPGVSQAFCRSSPGRLVKKGVDDNFAALKLILEAASPRDDDP